MEIELLPINDYDKCNNIWDMKKHGELSEKFLSELKSGNRIIYVCKDGDEYIGEISLVKETKDTDYTIPNKRIYVSHLVVKPDYRRRGIGKMLVEFVAEQAKELGYSEMSIGVDLNNYPALKLYTVCGFDKIVYTGEDGKGKFVKLLKSI